ncbi:hypothetical protein, partial [Staphylococcus aureus]|uniref:hypothetical protein n=1 Tax=Staphylococcus aureus TaxID=1280 RepID=UPI001C2ED322
GRFRACTWSSGDWHSLICLIDYREKKRFDSFYWGYRKFDSILRNHREPWYNWVKSTDATVWQPGFLPDLLECEKNPF